ncbi:MAG: hypothetical protein WD270_04105 [Acetobacterales bacterium]
MAELIALHRGPASAATGIPVCRPMPRVASLHASERLLLVVIRHWVEDPATVCPAVWAMKRAFDTGLCGPAIKALRGLMQAVGARPRPLRLLGSACPTLSPDERALLDLFAAHQHGREDHSVALMAWLVPDDDARDSANDHAAHLAYLLEKGGHRLRPPAAAPVPPARREAVAG